MRAAAPWRVLLVPLGLSGCAEGGITHESFLYLVLESPMTPETAEVDAGSPTLELNAADQEGWLHIDEVLTFAEAGDGGWIIVETIESPETSLRWSVGQASVEDRVIVELELTTPAGFRSDGGVSSAARGLVHYAGEWEAQLDPGVAMSVRWLTVYYH